MCKKRLQHMPVQYILGEWDFRDLVLVLRPPVFIPTPETEELVGHAADSIEKKNLQKGRFLEVGCGSGAITLSLLQKFPQMRAVCLDISSDACHLTQENAERLSLADRLEVYQADVCLDKDLHELKQQDRFDFIVSNPPYISSEEIPGLEKQIIEYEDLRALDGGPDGLRVVKSILSLSSTLLRPFGEVWLEVDVSQPVLIQQYVQEKTNLGLTYVATFQDYLGSNRFCLMRQARQEDKEGSAF
ncbi:hypothetical protein C0Q70_15022 [Pomacea canaliculata]|uniref:peptide chain release factor N(5)-glutamine methyltransferase n=1 Tax=Pomacea canaliculata TaxID=400727 RepID=A0A2T7NTP1_POMCA|nr:hemK methyltransferase family member 1-like [Pomacea canaliculata]PVD24539.1 hypothetical protein C0Q70_15022 [Pomacea canaliculata]